MNRSPFLALLAVGWLAACAPMTRGTGDLGVVIERATGDVLVVENSHATILASVEGLGDLSHASVV